MADNSPAPATAPTSRTDRVATKSLRANPHNPRMLFDKEPLKALENSIRRVGILVPITVYQATGSDKFTILDGQRRWMCALEIGLETVPINVVAEPSTAQNIVTMFQIHKLRKDWELMPTALKIEVLIEELLKESGESVTEAQMSVITGLDPAVITRCKKLLTYSKRYRDMMLEADPKDRIRADFFIELYPVLSDRVLSRAKLPKEHVIDRMLYKYQNRKSGMKSITDFRKIKSYVAIARAAGKEDEIIERYASFVSDDAYMLDDLEIDVARVHKQAKTIGRTASKLRELIADLSVDEFLGEEYLWVELERLVDVISKKSSDADRRRVP